MRAAETALERDPEAYQRYRGSLGRCEPLPGLRAKVFPEDTLPAAVAARALSEGTVTHRACGIQIRTVAAFREGLTTEEQRLVLAALLSHESTHITRMINYPWRWAVKIDKQWLTDTIATQTDNWRTQQRAASFSRLDSQNLAAVQAGRTTNIVAVKAEVAAEYRTILAETFRDIDREIAAYVRRDFAGEYRGLDLGPVRAKNAIEEECWAIHEELVTYNRIGGGDWKEILDGALFLNSSECRRFLNIVN